MELRTLGRTGLTVSSLGLGAGGPSRIGRNTGASDTESERVVQEPLDLGINFIDTAEGYQTESIIAGALKGRRLDDIVLPSKVSPEADGRLKTPKEIETSLDQTLRRLAIGQIDIYHMHGVSPESYAELRDKLYPTLERLKDKGKLKWIGITERFGTDSSHEMLESAVRDDLWDVMNGGL